MSVDASCDGAVSLSAIPVSVAACCISSAGNKTSSLGAVSATGAGAPSPLAGAGAAATSTDSLGASVSVGNDAASSATACAKVSPSFVASSKNLAPELASTFSPGGWDAPRLALESAIISRTRPASARASRPLRGCPPPSIAGFSEGLQAIRTMSDFSITVIYTAAHWGLVALIYLWICHAFAGAFVQADMTLPGAMLLLAITLVGSALQLPGVGGGAQVASFIALTTIFGVEQEAAAAIAIVLWIITFAASTLLGVPLLIHEGLSMGELRNLARAEKAAERTGEHVSLTRMADSRKGSEERGSAD